jgi:hypothetical protein
MELTRRFIFRGNAAAYGGRIYRPKNVVITGGATSSLTVVGGVSTGQSRPVKFEGFVSIGSATTSAEAAFDNARQALALTHGKVKEEELTTTTKVGASVENIVIGDKQSLVVPKKAQLRVGRLAGSLTSYSGKPGDEMPIQLGRETIIDGVEIDGVPLKIVLNTKVFQSFDTLSKLQAAASDPNFIEETGDCLFRGASVAAGTSVTGRSPDTLFGTIVKELRWAKQVHPTATIDHHSITVPELGVVFFGEILITATSRRVTLLRVKMGSHAGGMFASSEIDTNGSWVPPF